MDILLDNLGYESVLLKDASYMELLDKLYFDVKSDIFNSVDEQHEILEHIYRLHNLLYKYSY